MTALEKLFSLEGKVVVVTGGAQGIGRVVAQKIAEVGAEIAIFDVQGEKAKVAADEIAKATGKKVTAFEVDVTDPDAVKVAIEKAGAEMGTLDLLFNNAGIVLHKSAKEVTPAEWLKVIDVNLNGVYYVASEFAKYLIANGKKGSIVNTASMSGHIVNWPQEQASYNTSKAGVIHLTKSLAVEYCKDGIRVNSVSPGYMYTELTCHVRQDWQDRWMDLTPMERYGQPEELAGGVIYLLSDAASFTNGSDLVIDGCFSCV
ncbi:MAG: SDR family oxidoreductase [Lachnospiraceae bacterium]|nr:SDR family oxidoreductase [Lachnospiraceae bacterium]